MRLIAILASAALLVPAAASTMGCSSSDSGSSGSPTDDTGVSDDTSTGGGDTGTGGGDTGAGGGDTGTGGGDTGTGKDTGTSPGDTGTGADTGIGTDTGTPIVDSGPPGPVAMIGPCQIYPADNPWNRDVSKDAVSADNAKYLGTMHTSTSLHPDWGSVADQYGIPYTIGTGAAPVKMTWTASWGISDSDKLKCADGSDFCYPIPSTALIEGGAAASTTSDRHLLYLDTAGAPTNCTLYELYNAQNWTGPGWTAQNGAIFHLGSNALRPDGLTSSDAAGLPVLPGLVRYDEVKAGEIKHAIRFTMNNTYQGYIHPATHAAGLSSSSFPPMGLRMRLKASVDLSGYSGEVKVILTAMKKYGIILADNGSNWYISGDTNDGWSSTVMDNIVSGFGKIHGGDFEVVDSGPVSTAGL